MKTEPIPQWVIEYNNANHQSSAGKAIKILINKLETKETELTAFKKRLKKELEYALHGKEQTLDIVLKLIDRL